MKNNEWGLGGKGKNLLINYENTYENTEKDTVATLSLTQLVPSKSQPRKQFNEAALRELAASIKNQGILQPLLVRPIQGSLPQRYEIIAGERRWRAAKQAGKTEVPVIVTDYSDKEAMTAALIENLQREDLNPIEEADALKMLRDTYGYSQEDLAEQLGKSRPAIANALRLLQLPRLMQQGVLQGLISAGHARALLSVPDESLQAQLYDAITEFHLSVRETETAAEYCRTKNQLPEHLSKHKQEGQTEKKRISKPQLVKELQKLLRIKSGKKATISGDGTHGQVSIPYASEEELNALINMLAQREKH